MSSVVRQHWDSDGKMSVRHADAGLPPEMWCTERGTYFVSILVFSVGPIS